LIRKIETMLTRCALHFIWTHRSIKRECCTSWIWLPRSVSDITLW